MAVWWSCKNSGLSYDKHHMFIWDDLNAIHFITLVCIESETFWCDLQMEEVDLYPFLALKENSRRTNPLIKLWSRMTDPQLEEQLGFSWTKQKWEQMKLYLNVNEIQLQDPWMHCTVEGRHVQSSFSSFIWILEFEIYFMLEQIAPYISASPLKPIHGFFKLIHSSFPFAFYYIILHK